MEESGRKFVMGDIHGCYRGLLQCLERSGFDKQSDTLIQLGDVADGWSQVPECVEELLTVKNLISIRGNHDCWALNWFEYGDDPNLWLTQGGQSTKDAYLDSNLYEDVTHRYFWKIQIDYYIDGENRLFSHAGFDLSHGFEWSKTANLDGVKNSVELHWTRDCANFNTKSWGSRAKVYLDKFKEIYIGHTAHNDTVFNTPYKKNIWNLDTGAGHRGKLTIMDIDTKEYWQSDKVTHLYPNERGR
jgi:serine/threonine protein phosphatase 1